MRFVQSFEDSELIDHDALWVMSKKEWSLTNEFTSFY